MIQQKISPEIKLKIISLSKCFWFWNSYYNFYSSVLGVAKRKLEVKFPKNSYNKYTVTEIILDELEESENVDKIKEIISNFYNLEKPFDKNDNPKYEEAVFELKEFKNIVGKDVLQEEMGKKEFKEKLKKRKIEDSLEKEKNKKLDKMKNKFLEYAKITTQKEKQERGFWLEKSFYELLELEQIRNTKSYRNGHEQIDGHFKFKAFDYLVEIRWTDSQVKQKDISIFDGKLATKGQSTRGFILSISGFDKSAVDTATKGKPKLIFMDASEFMSILDGRNKFYDIFLSKEDGLARFGKVYK